MTTLHDDLTDVHPARAKIEIAMAVALTVPAFVVRFTHPDLPHPLEALLFGLAIVGAAFMLRGPPRSPSSTSRPTSRSRSWR
jgi:hypothetical protein